MISQERRIAIEKATVTTLSESGNGQGVYVGKNMILTAAHCFPFDSSGGIVLGDGTVLEVATSSGQQLKASLLFIDPVSDLAVLGPCDEQDMSDEYDRYVEWCEKTKPVDLRTQAIPPINFRVDSKPTLWPCYIRLHTGTWIAGSISRWGEPPWMSLEADEHVPGGTSGGPIVDESGMLLGVVSNAGGDEDFSTRGSVAIPQLSLPVWIADAVIANPSNHATL
jgi:hypothetical protein